MEKGPMCLSREEQDSMRALAGTAEETVELSQSLYQAVVQVELPITERLHVVNTSAALKPAAVPVFDDEEIKKT
jgi:hypothetical protein